MIKLDGIVLTGYGRWLEENVKVKREKVKVKSEGTRRDLPFLPLLLLTPHFSLLFNAIQD